MNGISAAPTPREAGWASAKLVLFDFIGRAFVTSSFSFSFVVVVLVPFRSSRQWCISTWSRQWRVSDQEDRTEVAVYHQQKTGWRQNEFQSAKRRDVQRKE